MNYCLIVRDPDSGTFRASIGNINIAYHAGLLGYLINRTSDASAIADKPLDAIIPIADANRIALIVEPLDSGGIKRDQMKAWYEMHGFVQGRSKFFMIRVPKKG